MAAAFCGFCRHLIGRSNYDPAGFLGRQGPLVNNVRNTGFFKYLAQEKEHNQTEYQYEVTQDPNEWQFVERLMPLNTVPSPTLKREYSSGWRPPKEEAVKLPYFVERSKNHMLSVYLENLSKGPTKVTKVKRIHGNLWMLHDELKSHLEEMAGKKLASFVHEGNQVIYFKGDHVYYTEQWLLGKGF